MQAVEIVANKNNRQNPKDGKQYLASVSTIAQAEGHAFILDEMQSKEITNYLDLLLNSHVGFDPKLEYLV